MSVLNKSGKKHRFGKAWMHEHVNDPYVKEAQRRGFRSRAAFKLLELVERDRLLRPGMTVVDLGSAPGSWCQVLRERLGGQAKIIAIDLLPMDGMNGVDFIQGDFSAAEGLQAVREALQGAPIDLVLSDMSPNLSGVEAADQARSIGLAELALDFAAHHLRAGGDFATKLFQGAGSDAFRQQAATYFDKVYVRKPKASRDRSREIYVVGKGFKETSRLS
ncbi:MAG: RlmE family RNA methyltransferase [Betaproteobacteria bacterium]|nr:RlmE family RNA methyltransferase [Betaproteobacteria bacterium]